MLLFQRSCLLAVVLGISFSGARGEGVWMVEAETCLRKGNTSIHPYEWASGGKAVWLRNAGDSIRLTLDKGLSEGYYRVRVRGRTVGPLRTGYELKVRSLVEPLRPEGKELEVGAKIGRAGWTSAVVFLRPGDSLEISNRRVWALVDNVELSPAKLAEKRIEAESGACQRIGKTTTSKYDWASGGGALWLNEAGAKLRWTVGLIRPGYYEVELRVRDHPALRRGNLLELNGFGAILRSVGQSQKVPPPAGLLGSQRARLYLRPGDVLEFSHLRAYALVDFIRIVPLKTSDFIPADAPRASEERAASIIEGLRNPALNPVQFLTSAKAPPIWLVRNGRPAASIVVAPVLDLKETFKQRVTGPLFSVRAAAEEFQRVVRQATGAELPVLLNRMPETGNAILIGRSRFTDELGIDLKGFGKSGFVVRTFPGKVVIAGRDGNVDPGLFQESGTLWGAYDFLERFLGVRWYYPGELGTIIPARKDLLVPAIHFRDEPHFKKHLIYRFYGQLTNMPPRLNGDFRSGAHFRNEDVSGLPTACHTFGTWKKRFGKKHPEFFELAKDGGRHSSQLCFSEPGVLKQLLAEVEENQNDIIPVSPIDISLNCQCPRCLSKLRPGGFLYQYSQVMGEFLFKFATEVKKRWPARTIIFLGYQNYTAPPEGVVFPDNLVVNVCGMRTLANYKEPGIYRDERTILDGWRKALKRPIGHWHYTCWPDDCTAAPFQFRHVMKRFFSDYADSLGTFVDAGIDWSRKHLTIYFLSRLMWNPEFNVDAAFHEYCNLMYGSAAPKMRTLLELLTDRWEQSRWSPPLPPYHRISLRNIHVETYPPRAVQQLRALYKGAIAAVDKDSLEAERIHFFGISLQKFFNESDRFHGTQPRRALKAVRTREKLNLDGNLKERCWKQAPPANFMTGYDAKAGPPTIRTTIQAIWNNSGVTFGLFLSEPDMENLKMTQSGRDDQVFLDDCIELFLDPKAKLADYHQIVINARGAVFDASSLSDPYSAWNCEGLKAAIHKDSDSWSMEVFIPFAALSVRAAKPGTFWYGNFTRSRWHGKFQLFRFYTTDIPPVKTSNLNMLNFGKILFAEK